MKPKRFIVCSDVHGDMADRRAIDAILAFVKDFKPEIRVMAGDLWDFRNLRRGASDEEKAHSLEKDWDAGLSFASAFFAGGRKNVFLRGNHDERLWDFLGSARGVLRDYAKMGVSRVYRASQGWNASMLPYDSAKGIMRLGTLRVIHGYHTGIGAAQQHARVYGNCLFGHTHSIEVNAIASLEPREARGIGCLCIRDMDYMNAKTGKLRWAQGWAYGYLFPNGTYQLFQARKIAGQFYVATKIESF